MDGFRVDLTALTHASEGVRDTINAMNRRKVSDIDSPADAFGHDRLATTVATHPRPRWTHQRIPVRGLTYSDDFSSGTGPRAQPLLLIELPDRDPVSGGRGEKFAVVKEFRRSPPPSTRPSP
ncbi:hypothetical protein AB0H34_19275 [Saccharopolyspora shandongensis]|uniref:hypothetical protein n=1 Tax=Saccharopolyspora shandongensis TaxID=418495 RepID=UPI0033F26891